MNLYSSDIAMLTRALPLPFMESALLYVPFNKKQWLILYIAILLSLLVVTFCVCV